MYVLEELDSLPLLWDPPHLWDPSQFVTPHYNNPNEAPHNNERLKRVRPHHSPQSSLKNSATCTLLLLQVTSRGLVDIVQIERLLVSRLTREV